MRSSVCCGDGGMPGLRLDVADDVEAEPLGEVRKRAVIGHDLRPLVRRHLRPAIASRRRRRRAVKSARRCSKHRASFGRRSENLSAIVLGDPLAVLRIEPVVRVARAGGRRPSRGSPGRRESRESSRAATRRDTPRAPGWTLRVAALLDERRQPADLQLAADDDQDVRLLQLEDEARLRLDEVRILVALAIASTVIRSPPTSRAIDARSSVVVTTLSLPCAPAGALQSAARRSHMKRFIASSYLLGIARLKPSRYWAKAFARPRTRPTNPPARPAS